MYGKILVPLDGSKFAENALDHLRSIAHERRVEKVLLVRVVEPLIRDARDFIGVDIAREAEDKLEAEAESYLEKTAAGLRKEGMEAEARMVVNGEPAAKILEIARGENVDLIIMCTHGKSAFFHWVFGSVAHKVLASSPVPILVVPRKNKGGSR
jgi:nucleotide-binding universal stress UspA family protein